MYLDHLSGIIFKWDGTLDKYVGDEIMASGMRRDCRETTLCWRFVARTT
jgi:hypothetical protein